MNTHYINTSGGIITNQFIESVFYDISQNEYIKPDTFQIENEHITKSKLDENIVTAWELLYPFWDRIASNIENEDMSKLRNRWVLPFFQMLDFTPLFLKRAVIINEEDKLSFNFSHRGWDCDEAPIIHIVKASQDLDKRDDTLKSRRKSPHDMLQTFLNCSQERWGILTNGKKLRILREHHLSYTKGYIEFNLAGIFESRNFKEFTVMYKLLHKSRFIIDKKKKSILDNIYDFCVTSGSTIGFGLQKSVKRAVELLGNGFLEGKLITKLQNSENECKEYYSEILNVIYRILFLLYAEQRGIMPGRSSLYMEEYSITSLRNKSEGIFTTYNNHTDIWEGLKVTFKMVSEGVPELGLYPYNGVLFDSDSTKMLNNLNCRNKEFLAAIRQITLFEKDGVIQRINYADLGVEELGSIYESLLDFSPRITKEYEQFKANIFDKDEVVVVQANTFILDPRGTDRKQTGSYYTNPKLVDELIKSALIPVVEDRINGIMGKGEKEQAILSIKVCDASVGSGPFLIAANNYLAMILAKIRADNDYPGENELRLAKRDILSHCIYGVDINSMVVELCKVSLWINACVREYPLNFLDHHIKCGNSLVGATSELIAKGILNSAFESVEGDDKKIALMVKKQNKNEIESVNQITFRESAATIKDLYEIVKFEGEEKTPTQVHEKIQAYYSWRNSTVFRNSKVLADIWTASFYWSLKKAHVPAPTFNVLECAKRGLEYVEKEILDEVETLSRDYKFFHWQLEFPEVFNREDPGFDCILGNPPWDKIQPEEIKFFKDKNQKISDERDADKRKGLISELEHVDNRLYKDWIRYKTRIEKESKFIFNSGIYTYSAIGNLNLYKLFTELNRQNINSKGRVGIIIQSGLFSDDMSKVLFNNFMQNKNFISVFDFQNTYKLFPIHSSTRFSLITFSRRANERTLFAYMLKRIEDMYESKNHVFIDYETIKLLNPNTFNCPIIKEQACIELLKKIYSRCFILKSQNGSLNSYEISLWGEMFNMTRARKYLWNEMVDQSIEYVPLYESKYFHQYDSRYATFKDVSFENRIKGNTEYCTVLEKNSFKPVEFRYFVNNSDVDEKCKKYKLDKSWLLGVRSIARATDERTIISSILPRYGMSNSVNILVLNDAEKAAYLLYGLNTFITDFIAGTKVGNQNLNIYIIEQLPFLPLEKFEEMNKKFNILSSIVKLVYTDPELKSFAQECGYFGEPYKWDDEERFQIQCELDAIYAKGCNLTRSELDYILESFPIVKQKDILKYGYFRTKEIIMKYFVEL